MYVITAPFDAEKALKETADLLAMGHSPEHLAELLELVRDLEKVRDGIQATSFVRVLTDVARLGKFLEIEAQIEKFKTDQSMLRFLGSGFKEKQLDKLREERGKLGSLLEAPRWFYRQPRVWLLSAIRDYALDSSLRGEPAWIEIEESTLQFPIVAMFENADRDGAQILVEEIEKPLQDISPRFLLESFEGNRSISFDFHSGVATYYTPTPIPTA